MSSLALAGGEDLRSWQRLAREGNCRQGASWQRLREVKEIAGGPWLSPEMDGSGWKGSGRMKLPQLGLLIGDS